MGPGPWTVSTATVMSVQGHHCLQKLGAGRKLGAAAPRSQPRTAPGDAPEIYLLTLTVDVIADGSTCDTSSAIWSCVIRRKLWKPPVSGANSVTTFEVH